MKIKLVLLLAFISTGILVNAQPGSGRRTIEERVQQVHEKFDSAFKLEPAVQTKVDKVFTAFFERQDQIRQELRGSGERPNFETMREKLKPAADARDKELKAILTEAQYTKWKDELEAVVLPQRPGRRNQ